MAFMTKTESELLERTFISSLFNSCFPSFGLSLSRPGRGHGPPPRKRPTRLSRHLVPQLDCAACATIASA